MNTRGKILKKDKLQTLQQIFEKTGAKTDELVRVFTHRNIGNY